jgi:ABC-type multidrug transport system fused ATPase/permease subunit
LTLGCENVEQDVMDEEIWEVLETLKMKEVIQKLWHDSTDKRKGEDKIEEGYGTRGLDLMVIEGGTNFSSGQRQLLCFARAILNNWYI